MKDFNRDSQFIKVLAAQAKNERVETDVAAEAAEICSELVKECMTSQHAREQIAQTVAWAVEELRSNTPSFLDVIADRKVIGWTEEPIFTVPQGSVMAYEEAAFSTPPRSMVGAKTLTLKTREVAARPAISAMDARQGRVDFAELIREANEEITKKELKAVFDLLTNTNLTHRYATGYTLANLSTVGDPLRRYGNVIALGDISTLTKWSTSATPTIANIQAWGDTAEQDILRNGFLNTINGISFRPIDIGNEYAYVNGAYTEQMTALSSDIDKKTILIPANMNANMRNIKIAERGGVEAVDHLGFEDGVYEMIIRLQFGCAFITGRHGFENIGVIHE